MKQYIDWDIVEESPTKDSASNPAAESHSSDNELDRIYCSLGRLASRSRGPEKIFKHNSRVNRFLLYQETRIKQAVADRNWTKAFLIWMMLLKTSKGYQLVLYNRVNKAWYRSMEVEHVRLQLQKLMNKCRRFDMNLGLRRFYVIKNKIDQDRNGMVYQGELLSGEKLRPIGCPDIPSRAISRCMTDLIYCLYQDTFAKFQHGYRKGLGAHTVVREISREITENDIDEIYEFDFKSFFNKIRPSWVYRKLLARGQLPAELVAKIICQIQYEFKELYGEAELKDKGEINHFGTNLKHIVREGLPQGLGISPLLATMVLELFKAPKGLYMYADDGVYVGDKHKFDKWIEDIGHVGAVLEPEKSGWTNRSKFLGMDLDLQNGRVWYKSEWVPMAELDRVEELTKTRKVSYVKEKIKGWTWQIEPRSYISSYGQVEGLGWKLIPILWNSLIKGKTWKGYRYFWGIGVRDVMCGSSECLNSLISRRKELNLCPIKPFNANSFIFRGKFSNYMMIKGHKRTEYFETLYENDLRAYIRKTLPEWKNVLENVY